MAARLAAVLRVPAIMGRRETADIVGGVVVCVSYGCMMSWAGKERFQEDKR
jgi:hypothetical protein